MISVSDFSKLQRLSNLREKIARWHAEKAAETLEQSEEEYESERERSEREKAANERLVKSEIDNLIGRKTTLVKVKLMQLTYDITRLREEENAILLKEQEEIVEEARENLDEKRNFHLLKIKKNEKLKYLMNHRF